MVTTITTNTNVRDEYTATAGQTVFPYTFWALEAAHIAVYQNGTKLTSGYSVDVVQSDTGGNITLDSGATLNDSIIITLNPEIERNADYQTSGSFKATTVNTELAYLISLVQWVATQLNRKFGVSDTTTAATSLAIPDPVANTVLGWNSAGTAIENKTLSEFPDTITISTSGLADEDVLAYDLATGNWQNLSKSNFVTAVTTALSLTDPATDDYASQAEAEAGLVDDKVMSPLRVAQAINTLASSSVTSVAGRTGAVTLTSSDVSLGNVVNVDQTDASNLASGTVATARLGSGTANSSTFLRGDGSWAAVSVSPPSTSYAVGSYALAKTSNVVSSGATISGSLLTDIHFDSSGSPQTGVAMSGTWRNMGSALSNTDIGLFVRTA